LATALAASSAAIAARHLSSPGSKIASQNGGENKNKLATTFVDEKIQFFKKKLSLMN
jgi:hypothetical protein